MDNYTKDSNNYQNNNGSSNYPAGGNENLPDDNIVNYSENDDTRTFEAFGDEDSGGTAPTPVEPPVVRTTVKTNNDKKVIIICVSIVIAVALIATACVFGIIAIRNLNSDDTPSKEKIEKATTEEDQEEAPAEEEIDKAFPSLHTLLLTVPDETNNNVDMIMLFVFNHDDRKIDIVSLPRGTVVDGKPLYEIAKVGKDINMNRLTSSVKKITGIPVDAYAHMPISSVKDTVDIFGDVYFYVPQRMEYYDEYQNLSINLYPGYNYLDGNESEQLLRYQGYYDKDITRTKVQRSFMIEAFKQKATSENLSRIPEWYKKVGRYIKKNIDEEYLTDLAALIVEDEDNPYSVDDHIIPCSRTGEDSYVLNDSRMTSLAKELGFEK